MVPTRISSASGSSSSRLHREGRFFSVDGRSDGLISLNRDINLRWSGVEEEELSFFSGKERARFGGRSERIGSPATSASPRLPNNWSSVGQSHSGWACVANPESRESVSSPSLLANLGIAGRMMQDGGLEYYGRYLALAGLVADGLHEVCHFCMNAAVGLVEPVTARDTLCHKLYFLLSTHCPEGQMQRACPDIDLATMHRSSNACTTNNPLFDAKAQVVKKDQIPFDGPPRDTRIHDQFCHHLHIVPHPWLLYMCKQLRLDPFIFCC